LNDEEEVQINKVSHGELIIKLS
jgi:hypothetical protein